MNYPLVSIIIPNYCHAPYLEQRITSVLNQTYPNFEVIILDDKSPDNSLEIINKFRNDAHIKHIVANERNSGSTFVQWNKGIELSNGEIIWIAESDDYCEPTFLEKCVSEYVKDKNCAIVYCSSEYVDSQNNDLGTYSVYPQEKYHLTGKDFIKERAAFGCAIWNASSAIFNKNLALIISKQYESYKACGDRLFWIEMAELGNVIHINEILNYFRQHQNKVSPKRFRDGTSLTEEREIYKYQCAKRYLIGLRRIFILNLYKNKIDKGTFDSSMVKDKLNSLWGFDNRLKNTFINFVSRIYIYFHLYILRKKPI